MLTSVCRTAQSAESATAGRKKGGHLHKETDCSRALRGFHTASLAPLSPLPLPAVCFLHTSGFPPGATTCQCYELCAVPLNKVCRAVDCVGQRSALILNLQDEPGALTVSERGHTLHTPTCRSSRAVGGCRASVTHRQLLGRRGASECRCLNHVKKN